MSKTLHPAFVAKLAREVSKIVGERMGVRQGKEYERELREAIILSQTPGLKGYDPKDLQALNLQSDKVRSVREMARDIAKRILAEPEGAWTPHSITALLRESVDGRFWIGPVEPDAPRFKIALRVKGDAIKFGRFAGLDIEDIQRKLVDSLKASGAQLFFFRGYASAFEAVAQRALLAPRRPDPIENANPDQGFCFVAWEVLPPGFRGRVAGRRTDDRVCGSCGGPIETADQIAGILCRGTAPGATAPAATATSLICCSCAQLPRPELIEKVFDVVSSEARLVGRETPELFLSYAKLAECVVAICCGLDPEVDVDWSVPGDWHYGLFAASNNDR